MENNTLHSDLREKKEKKPNKFLSFLKVVFVNNLGIKLLSIGLAAALVFLAVAL